MTLIVTANISISESSDEGTTTLINVGNVESVVNQGQDLMGTWTEAQRVTDRLAAEVKGRVDTQIATYGQKIASS